MKRTRLVIVIGFVLSGSFAFAQDEKTELGVFAGGYFNSGFQSFKVLNPITGAQVGTFKPVSEANSGIFGARGSYQFRPQMAAEATFGFSHRWPHPKSFCVRSCAGFCGDSTANTYRASLAGIAGWECVSLQWDSSDLSQSARNVETVLHGRSRKYHENIENRISSEPPTYSRGSNHDTDLFAYPCSSDHSNRDGPRTRHRIQFAECTSSSAGRTAMDQSTAFSCRCQCCRNSKV